jgi:hypothetical protein
MALYFDRCLETTTTTGTGDITTAGAIAGFRTLNSAYGTGVNIPYCIEAVDASGVPTGDWETGQGTLSTTTNFQRTRVYASSNANALVSFAAGTKRIFATVPAERGFTQGQSVSRTLGMEQR